jgi:hypothetical protein
MMKERPVQLLNTDLDQVHFLKIIVIMMGPASGPLRGTAGLEGFMEII